MTTIVAPNTAQFSPAATRELALAIDELEALDALDWSWSDFYSGMKVGVGIAAAGAAGVIIGIAIT